MPHLGKYLLHLWFCRAEILAGLGSMWEKLRHVMPPLGSSLLALPKKENLFYVSLLFLFFFSSKAVFYALHSSDFKMYFLGRGE